MILLSNNAKIIPLETNHYTELWHLITDSHEQIFEHYPYKIRSFNDMQTIYDKVLQNKKLGNEYPFVIIDRKSDAIVGSTSFLDIQLPNRNLEIGRTWLHQRFWGTHFNTECKYILLCHCFETLKLVRVQLKTDITNIRSQKAIEKLGAVREGVLRSHIIREDGTLRDSVYYSILASEWQGVKEKLKLIITQ